MSGKRDVQARPLLTLNCHEAWVHQLQYLDRPFDVVDGLPGRYAKRWDEHVRPVPRGATLRTLEDVLARPQPYGCIIAHNLTDLLDVKTISAPRLLVLHSSLEGRMASEGLDAFPEDYVRSVVKYTQLLNVHVVAVSRLKGDSWTHYHEAIPFGADPDAYLPWTGEVAAGLRVANQIRAKARVLKWDFHEAAFAGVPVRIVGHNPDMPGVTPSESWQHLKQLLASHRFYIHTADAPLEDGYNMATLEAMAAGLPVLGNVHPSSPVQHGVSGFLSNDPAELRKYAQQLLDDRELAGRMGQAARKTVVERFSTRKFAKSFSLAIEAARKKWKGLPG